MGWHVRSPKTARWQADFSQIVPGRGRDVELRVQVESGVVGQVAWYWHLTSHRFALATIKNAWDSTILIHVDRKRTGPPTLSVRLVKKVLPSGEIAVFSTNLFSISVHTADAISDLYCYRWDIETAFREMKVWHGLENFHAGFADGIRQEVTALMIYMLLTAELEH